MFKLWIKQRHKHVLYCLCSCGLNAGLAPLQGTGETKLVHAEEFSAIAVWCLQKSYTCSCNGVHSFCLIAFSDDDELRHWGYQTAVTTVAFAIKNFADDQLLQFIGYDRIWGLRLGLSYKVDGPFSKKYVGRVAVLGAIFSHHPKHEDLTDSLS